MILRERRLKIIMAKIELIWAHSKTPQISFLEKINKMVIIEYLFAIETQR